MKKLIAILVFITTIYFLYSQTPVYYPGFPKIIQGERPYLVSAIPLITDLEKDGQKEIVFVSLGSFDYLHVIKSDGNELANFPRTFTSIVTAYASGDVDNNGTVDIVVRTAFYHPMQIIAIDKNGNNLPGFPVTYGDNGNQGQTARFLSLYDLDGDGKLEIIVNRLNEICVFEHNGQIRSGWPRRVVGVSHAFPAAGDLNGDGYAEIIVATYKYIPSGGTDSSALHIFRHNGASYSSNWPVYYDSGYSSWYASPSLYLHKLNPDSSRIFINQYGSREGQYIKSRNVMYDVYSNMLKKSYIYTLMEPGGIVIMDYVNYNYRCVNGQQGGQYDTSLYRYDNLTISPGWPRVGVGALYSRPVIGRFTYSNELNVLANTWSAFNPSGYGCIYGYRYNGEQLPWSPLRPEGLVQAISSADINNDGSVELIAISSRTGNETYLHVWTFPNVPFSYEDFPWPQFGHDRYRTNQYGFLPPDEPIGIQPINNNVPVSFKLHQNYPNPFNPFTNIRFDVPSQSNIRLAIYDVLGRELEVLVNEQLKAGEYRVNWDATKYSSGIYFYRITSGSYSETRKMIVAR